MSRSRWCVGRPPVRFELDTGAAVHRISWVRGSLVLHDHDVEAERVLEALGGEPCLCLALLEACREPTADFARGHQRIAPYRARAMRAPQHVPPRRTLAQVTGSPHFARLPRVQQAQVLGAMRRHHLRARLPTAMLEVLGAAWEVRCERQAQRPRTPPDRSAEERLQAAVAPACEEAMRRSRRDLRPYASITVECWKRGRGEAPLLNGWLDSAGGALASPCRSRG